MAEAFSLLEGVACDSVRLTIPNQGEWFVDVELTEEKDFAGKVSLAVGSAKLSGTVEPGMSGEFGLTKHVRIVAGGGAWGRKLTAKGYSNDAGVKARTVVDDLAREVGETLGDFAPSEETVGNYWVREAGSASTTLTEAIGTASWWVDFAGVTQVGTRPEKTLKSLEVEHYHPGTGTLHVHIDEITDVAIGATVEAPTLPAPVVITEIEITITDGQFRCVCATSRAGSKRSRATELFLRLARRATPQLFGKYRYRVVQMNGKRMDLQVVRKASGAPDILRVSQWAGIGGAITKAKNGSIVLVEFVEGLRSIPVVTGFDPEEDPEELTLFGGQKGIARQGDTVKMLLPPLVFQGTVAGAPATGILTALVGTLQGSITTASTKGKCG